jgi:hypothetical protein
MSLWLKALRALWAASPKPRVRNLASVVTGEALFKMHGILKVWEGDGQEVGRRRCQDGASESECVLKQEPELPSTPGASWVPSMPWRETEGMSVVPK